mmetsp:Transcript_54479/g.100750  ORF Transcript_54479/g.100750 Transcript_54479/m.100750 type:complete len:885 (+) Transcript_54479:144-2798(+)
MLRPDPLADDVERVEPLLDSWPEGQKTMVRTRSSFALTASEMLAPRPDTRGFLHRWRMFMLRGVCFSHGGAQNDGLCRLTLACVLGLCMLSFGILTSLPYHHQQTRVKEMMFLLPLLIFGSLVIVLFVSFVHRRMSLYSETFDNEPVHHMSFPMWVVSVEDLLKMEGTPRSHQQLLSEGCLRHWQPGSCCIFVSHQWLATDHPDPCGHQLHILQEALRNLITGVATVENDPAREIFLKGQDKLVKDELAAISEGYVWLDWFGVPQLTVRVEGKNDDPQVASKAYRAVQSIPAYVEACRYFWVLAPHLEHSERRVACDYNSWRSRGWCRAELWCRVLSTRATAIIVVRSTVLMEFMPAQEWFQARAWEGEFTVEHDRAVVQGIVTKALDAKMQSLRRQGEAGIIRYRWFASMQTYLEHSGKTAAWNQEIFLKNLGFRLEPAAPVAPMSAPVPKKSMAAFSSLSRRLEVRVNSFSPVLCAALAGDAKLVLKLAELSADVNQRLHVSVVELGLRQGMTPLMVTNYCNPSVESLAALVDARADLNATHLGTTALGFSQRNASAVDLLLSRRADLELRSSFRNTTPLMTVLFRADVVELDVVKLLLQRLADVNPPLKGLGLSPLHILAVFGDRPDIAELLLKHRADINAKASPTGLTLAYCQACQLSLRWFPKSLRRAPVTRVFCAEMPGAAPVALAALRGHEKLVDFFLLRGAVLDTRNDAGHDAATLLENNFTFQCLNRSGSFAERSGLSSPSGSFTEKTLGGDRLSPAAGRSASDSSFAGSSSGGGNSSGGSFTGELRANRLSSLSHRQTFAVSFSDRACSFATASTAASTTSQCNSFLERHGTGLHGGTAITEETEEMGVNMAEMRKAARCLAEEQVEQEVMPDG